MYYFEFVNKLEVQQLLEVQPRVVDSKIVNFDHLINYQIVNFIGDDTFFKNNEDRQKRNKKTSL